MNRMFEAILLKHGVEACHSAESVRKMSGALDDPSAISGWPGREDKPWAGAERDGCL